jgi:uncharacterized repeat protein (TIGR03803 family)
MRVKVIGFVSTFGCGVPAFGVPAVIAALSLILAGRAEAQTLTPLHNFAGTTQWGDYFTNSDGAGPDTGLILSGNTLYGTTYYAGTNGNGTVFAVNSDGTGFTTLHGFTRGTGSLPNLINSDGAIPYGGLLLSGNTLYGTASYGGTNGTGTVFALNTDGTGFTILHSFTAVHPYPGPYTNSDGVNPSADLVLSGNTLYGTCYRGGTSDAGTVFALNTDGTGFAVLHSFTALSPSPAYTNSDVGGLFSGLILSGNTLYGAAYNGGSSGNGTVFALNTDGTGFTNLHSFTASASADVAGDLTNCDGDLPNGGLILSGNTLYGTAEFGGSFGIGTVFAVNTDGTGFTTLHSFTGGSDGSRPWAGLLLSGNTLYGTAGSGGTGGYGTVFSIFIQPQLSIIPSGPYVILTWPTNYAGFSYAGYTLQSTANPGPSAVWSTNSSPPVVIGGQEVVTNAISGRQQFFRLSQ